ncbi:type II toxin-antitoxin system VapC family toxin [Rhizobium sp. CB3090]|uniref:type II toxin-antitoxin system VapC family toxin n=1 Tax=Rhizobium sp. CB3090 TaxID=3039156 RepID=UPI0024B19B42|nr:type II toxin-antitoxin system VapC family toxin [Rhizobium sp. CB3090]WFU07827.1 type II toxin-antitoxin system VapC family toxin [Rhizobium sp. CB3090]
MYLLDTNIVSDVRRARSGKADQAVLDWIASVPEQLLFISAVTLFEIELGILQVERRDKVQGAALRSWMEQGVKAAFQHRVVAINDQIALRCAYYSVPDPRELRDAFIGATAWERGFILVTRNTRHFQGMDIELLNPWST